jgi:hypothetical protein
MLGLPSAAPLVRMPLAPGHGPHGVGAESNVALYRFVSKLIAEHLGTVVKVVTGAVWLAVDVKTLQAHRQDPRASPGQKLADMVNVASSVVGTLGVIPGLEAVEKIEMPIHFFADLGESMHQGQVTLNGLDLMSYASGDAAKVAEVSKLVATLASGA